MGLDLVELVIEIEETFQIKVEDDQAARMRTVGDVADYIVARLPDRASETCLSAAVFYRLRRSLTELVGANRRAVAPRVETASLLPIDRRRASWLQISTQLGWRFPPLERPAWVTRLLTLVVVVGYLSTVMGLRWIDPVLRDHWGIAAVAAIPAWILVARWCARFSRPLATVLPRGCETLGGLSSRLLHLNLGTISRELDATDREIVWSVLRGLVVEALGVKPEQVTREARFVEDLGAD